MKIAFLFAELISGVTGVLLGVNAAIKLFNQITVIREINPLLKLEDQRKFEKDDLYRDLAERINIQIRHTQKVTEDRFRDDKRRWLNQIKWGAFLSVLSILFSFISNCFS